MHSYRDFNHHHVVVTVHSDSPTTATPTSDFLRCTDWTSTLTISSQNLWRNPTQRVASITKVVRALSTTFSTARPTVSGSKRTRDPWAFVHRTDWSEDTHSTRSGSLIKREWGVPVVTVYSRGQIKELGELYHDNESEGPLVRPPGPRSSCPRGTRQTPIHR